MKRAALYLIATVALSGLAHAGSLAGAQDGVYRAPQGGFVVVDSEDGSVGVQGLDCKKPIVAGGRLRAKGCWANGHLGGDVDVSWRVEGDAIVSEGERYVLDGLKKAAATVPSPETVEITGRPWSHNGSSVFADPETGLIAYDEPKASIRAVVKRGTVLFRGSLREGKVEGTAYAYKAGCAPAAYPVKGVYSDRSYKLTLRGPGPVRNGCDVIGYSESSPHALLKFSYILDD